MTKEEKVKAKQAMIMALTPRTRDGHIVPMHFEDQQLDLLYPCFDLDENGLVGPMICLEDFADGKFPKNLKYVPGSQTEFVPIDDPRYFNSICYKNPELNLPPMERHVLWEWRNSCNVQPMNARIAGGNSTDSAKQSDHTADKKSSNVPKWSDEVAVNADMEVTNAFGELRIKTPQDEVLLATFSIEAVGHRLVHNSESMDDIVDEYELQVNTKGKEMRIVIASKDINSIVDIVQKRLPMCTVSTHIKKAHAIIVNFVRKQLTRLPERHYVRVSGFLKLGGGWVFAHDGAEVPGGDVVFQTSRTIPVDTYLTRQGAFRNAIEFLGLSEKLELMLPMLLVAHLSPMFNLFAAAGHIPRFVTFICGRTGSLKTSVCLVLFRLFAEQPDSPEANFKDTEVALEIKLGEARGKVVLLDDYRPPVTSVDGKSNLAKLESVVRASGDRVSKSRSNPELGKAKEYLPTGCVVVTGEDLGGTQSSQLRMLILPIAKGDIDGKKLKSYQESPMLLTTHISHFLKWVGENGDAIIEFIRTNYDAERDYYATSLRESRVVDTAATLMLTARILHAYGTAIGAIDVGSGTQRLYDWRQAILGATIGSEGTSKNQNPVCMYLQAFFDLWDRREIEIAADIKTYEANRHIGYAVGENLWLWNKQVYGYVCRYWQKIGVLFPLTCDKVSEHLDSAGVIITCTETRGNGVKKLRLCKSSLPSRSRLLVLNEPLARRYLENESE